MSFIRTLTVRFAGDIQDLQRKAQNVQTSLSNMGSGLRNVGGQFTKYVTAPVAGAAAALGGLTAAAGWKRLTGIDRARAQFQGLGYDAEKVMAQVDAGVTGTALSMADGASMAVGILATGAVPMAELEDQIQRVANVSAAYGLEAAHAGNLLNRTLTKGKVEWGDLSQMQENGIPIVSQLAEYYGVAGAEIQKMAQEGAISIEDLNTVLDENAGAAAEEYAKSWDGIRANITSNIGRIGAAMLEPTFEIVKDQAAEFLELLRSPDFATAAQDIGTVIGDAVQGMIDRIRGLVEWWGNLSEGTRGVIVALAGVAVAIGPVLMAFGTMMQMASRIAGVVRALTMVANPIGLIVVAIAAVVAGLVWFFTQTETGQRIVTAAWEGIQSAIAAVTDWWTGTAQPAIARAWDAILTAAAAVLDWYDTHIAPVFETIGELIRAVVEEWILPLWDKLVEAWEWTWGQIQDIWNVIGPPLLAIVETGFKNLQTILSTVWNVIKTVIETVLGVIRGIIQTVTALIRGDWSGAWEAIKRTFSTIWDGTKRVIETAISGIATWLSNSWDGIKTTASRLWGGVRDSIMDVVDPLVTRISNAFERAKDGVGTALDKIKGAAAKPINFVINTVWNDGLRAALNLIPGVNLSRARAIPGYATGGYVDLPWSSAHRDPYLGVTGGGGLFRFEGEEFIFPRDFTRRHRRSLEAMLAGDLHVPAYQSGGAVRPVPGGHSGWNGGRYRSGGWHGGLDFPAATGTPISAMWGGRVSRALRLNRSYGHHAMLDHGSGMQTLYAHMSRLMVSVGQMVSAGQRIGLVGSTGNSTGPHLHLEVRRNGTQLNPEGFLSGAQNFSIFDLPKMISDVLRDVRTGLTGEWGSLIRTGVTEAINTARDWGLRKLGIPGYANGTISARRGWAWVGEHGPELVGFGGGETVIPHRQSLNLAAIGRGGGGDTRRVEELLLQIIQLLQLAAQNPTLFQILLDEGDIMRPVRHELKKLERSL